MSYPAEWKGYAQQVHTEIYALYLAYRVPRVPWYVRVLAAGVAGYALGPIDLIPDPISLLDYLDNHVILPLGILLVLRLIPPDIIPSTGRRPGCVERMGTRRTGSQRS